MYPNSNNRSYRYPQLDNAGDLESTPSVSSSGTISSPDISSDMHIPKGPKTLLHMNRLALAITGLTAVVVVIAGVVTLSLSGFKPNNQQQNDSKQPANSYDVNDISISSGVSDQLVAVTQASKLSINGELQVGNTFVITPTATPSAPKTGQIYYDQSTNVPYVYNGTEFVSLVTPPTPSAGATVTTVQGQTGNVLFGEGVGISISGTRISNAGVTSLQGTSDQVIISASKGAVQLSLPQAISTTSSPTFTGLSLLGALSVNSIQQTAGGNDVTISAGSDDVVITSNGRTFRLPTVGGSDQVICTTDAACAAGGGSYVVMQPGSAQTDTGALSSIWINKTGAGNLLQLQSSGVNTFVVAGNGNVTGGTYNGATISGGTLSGGVVSGGTLTATAVNGLNVSGTAITGSSALTVSAGGANQNLTLQATGTGLVVVKNPSFNNANGATYTFSASDGSGVNATICTTEANCVGSSGGGVSSTGTGTSTHIPLFTTDGYHFANSIYSQNLGATAGSVAGDLAVTGNLTTTGTINGATISGGTVSGGSISAGTISGGTLTATAVNSLNVSGTAISGTGALTVSAGGTNQNLTLQGTGTGSVVIKTPSFNNANGATYTFDPADTVSVNATICTSQGNCVGSSGGGVSSTGSQYSIAMYGSDGYHLDNSILSQNAGGTTLTVAGATIQGTGALTLSAGGTNQNLTLQGSGTGSVVVKKPSFNNANGATYTFSTSDNSGVTATICTTAGNCTGASGGGVVSTGTQYSIAVYGSDGYHLENSILSQNVAGTSVAVAGALTTTGTINGATITGGNLSGGTINGATISGGTLTATAVNGLDVSGTAITGTNDLTISAGGTNQNLTLQGSGTGVVAVTGNLTTTGTINGATLTGGSFTGGTVSGGTLSASAVNGLNVNSTAIGGVGPLTISAGGTNQNLTLQGSGTGVVAVTGNLTTTGTINGATITGGNLSGGTINGATISGGTLTATAVNSLNVSGTAITGTAALTISAGGTNQNLTLQGSGSGLVVIKTPSFNNANGATYSFDAADGSGVTATICTSVGNCSGTASVSSTGTSNSVALYGSDGNHLVDSIISQDVGATTVTVTGALAATGTINGATISGGTVSGGTLSGGTISGGTLTSSAVNSLNVSGTAITGTGALTISAGGTNQNLTLQGSGTGSVVIKTPSFNNANGATYSFDAADGSGVTATICTTQGNCTGASGGGVVSTGTQYSIAVYGSDGYHLENSILSQNAGGTTLTVSGSTFQSTGALTISAGGTNQNLTLQGSGTGSVVIKTPSFNNANGATYSFNASDGSGVNATICTTEGNCTGSSGGGIVSTGTGTSTNIPLFTSDGYHFGNSIYSQDLGATTASIAGDLTTTGTINGATITGGNLSGGTFNGATISGGTLTSSAVNSLNVSGTAITGTGALTISAGGTNQNLTLQGSGTGVVAVTGNLTTTGTINGATISGGSFSGGTISGGTLTSSAVNSLNVSGTAITGTGALTISAGGTNQNLTIQGTGTGVVVIKTPSFNNANGATYAFSATDNSGVNATICTTQGNCTGASGGGIVSTGSSNSIAFYTTDGYHFGNSIISQDAGATTATISGSLTTTGSINAASISGGTLSGGTITGGSLSSSAVNGLNVSSTAISGTGALTISAGGTNQNLNLQGSGTGVVAVTGNLSTTGTINTASITGGTLSGGTLSAGTISGGTLTATAVNSLNVSGTAISGTGALSISAGGTNQNLTLQGTGTGVVAVTGNLTTTGTINGATISGGTVSGGSISAGTISGGTLTATAVNSLNVSGTAISGTGALTVSAGGTNQNLTLQGTGTGSVVIKTPSFNNANGATYTFDPADGSGVTTTICTLQSGCTGSMTNSGSQYTIPMFGSDAYHLSGSILSQDAGATTLTVNGSTITGNSALTLSAGGTNQNLTLQGSGTGVVAVTGTLTATTGINIASGQTYRINGSQIASSNLSDGGNLGKLNATNTWTAANTFSDAVTGVSITLGNITTLYSGTMGTQATSSASTNSGAITLKSGNATGSTSNSGSVTIDSGTATGTTGSVLVGNTNASNVTIGNTTAATAVSIQGGSTGGISIGTANAATPITIGNIANAVSQVIRIGNNATASSTDTISIGNLLSTSTTTIQGGTGSGAISLQMGSSGSILIGTVNAGTVSIGNASGTVTLTGTVNAVSGLSVNGTNVITSGRQLANLTIPTAGSVLYGSAGAYGIPYVNNSNVLQFANINGTYGSTTKCLMSDGSTGLGFGTCPGGGGGGWGLTGNSGTSGGTNFLGTTDAQDLVLKTNTGGGTYGKITIAGSSSSGTVTVTGGSGGGNLFIVQTNGGSTLFQVTTGAGIQGAFRGSVGGTQACLGGTPNGSSVIEIGGCSSSMAYKHGITALSESEYEDVLAKIQGTNIYRYYHNTDSPDFQRTGVISEYMPAELTQIDQNGHPTPDWFSVYGYLWAGVRELANRTDTLTTAQQALTDQLSDITAMLDTTNLAVTAQAVTTDSLTVNGLATIDTLHVANATVSGNLTVQGALSVGNITVNGHVITSGGQPTSEAQTAAGSGATVSVDGTDTLGTITVTTGSAPTSGEMAKIIFNKVYGKAPRVVLSASDDNAAGMRFHKGVTSTGNFILNFKDAPEPNTTYTFDYFIGE